MARSYTVSTEVVFSASHALDGYEGDCSRVHGHNWTLRVYYEFSRLDRRGIAVDYRELESKIREVILPLYDHRHLNDVHPFDEMNPTSENIAAEIFKTLQANVVFEGGKLAAVEVWETPADMVRYREE
jgi:6-pyruvoyltetrahydropterin/6-carboxytetrahydropterin synthase